MRHYAACQRTDGGQSPLAAQVRRTVHVGDLAQPRRSKLMVLALVDVDSIDNSAPIRVRRGHSESNGGHRRGYTTRPRPGSLVTAYPTAKHTGTATTDTMTNLSSAPSGTTRHASITETSTTGCSRYVA